MPSAEERSRLLAGLDECGERCTLRVDRRDIAVTHLDRVYWPAVTKPAQPAITKRDFLRYLVSIAPAMLPHVRDRPLTLFRWPEGIANRRVLEKHWNITLPPFVERVDVFSESKGCPDQYLLCNNLATLLWLAHMGTLEIHTWHSRVRGGPDTPITSTDFASCGAALHASLLEFPDYLLFDIDPFIYSGKEPRGTEPAFHAAAFAKATKVAGWLESLLDEIRLPALVKTSGKTGLHVIVPIRRTLRFDAVREMARFIAERVMREHREDITLDWAVDKRTGKVFVDTNMNVRGKSIIAPYSPRGLPGAPISMPLEWHALKDADPSGFGMVAAVARLRKRGDAWAGWLDRKRSVEEVLSSVIAE